MDEFLKVGDENSKETRVQKPKRKNPVDKRRVARLKRTFLPYWARETELESKTTSDVDASR
jgi:hypothetical protein